MNESTPVSHTNPFEKQKPPEPEHHFTDSDAPGPVLPLRPHLRSGSRPSYLLIPVALILLREAFPGTREVFQRETFDFHLTKRQPEENKEMDTRYQIPNTRPGS